MIRIEFINDAFVTEDITIEEFYVLPINKFGFMTLPSGRLINIYNTTIVWEVNN